MQRLEQEQVNANEMADLMILFDSGRIYEHSEEIATMLRQQQAEYYSLLVNHDKLYAKVIEQQAELEALKKESALQRLSDFTQEADNEPVAWMHQNPDYAISKKWSQEYNIPLYTHPAKTLTDEEILEIANQSLVGATAWHNPDLDPINFARAILRKAQEG